MPIGRWSIYAAKLLVALSTLVLAVGVGIEGFVLLTLRPDLGLTLPIPWSTIFSRAVVFAVAALLLVGVVGGLVVAVLGCWTTSRGDVQ